MDGNRHPLLFDPSPRDLADQRSEQPDDASRAPSELPTNTRRRRHRPLEPVLGHAADPVDGEEPLHVPEASRAHERHLDFARFRDALEQTERRVRHARPLRLQDDRCERSVQIQSDQGAPVRPPERCLGPAPAFPREERARNRPSASPPARPLRAKCAAGARPGSACGPSHRCSAKRPPRGAPSFSAPGLPRAG
jgi:hypothetical protein